MNALLIGVTLAVVVVAAVMLLRRKPGPAGRPAPQAPAAASQREMMLQIVIPDSGVCCAAAHQIETHRFVKALAPPLPLGECSMKQGCRCRYQPVPDRRIGERRQSSDKREIVRYEDNPRRAGHGRRAGDKLFDHDPD